MIEKKTLWEKEKMHVTKIFDLSQNVFEKLLSFWSLKVGIVWKRIQCGNVGQSERESSYPNTR